MDVAFFRMNRAQQRMPLTRGQEDEHAIGFITADPSIHPQLAYSGPGASIHRTAVSPLVAVDGCRFFYVTLYSDGGRGDGPISVLRQRLSEDCRGKGDERAAPRSSTPSPAKASESIKTARRGIWHLIIKQNRLCSVHFLTAPPTSGAQQKLLSSIAQIPFKFIPLCVVFVFFFLSFPWECSIRRRPSSLVFQAGAHWDKSLWHHTPPSWC